MISQNNPIISTYSTFGYIVFSQFFFIDVFFFYLFFKFYCLIYLCFLHIDLYSSSFIYLEKVICVYDILCRHVYSRRLVQVIYVLDILDRWTMSIVK